MPHLPTACRFVGSVALLAGAAWLLAACHDEDDDGPSMPPVEVQGLWIGTVDYPVYGTQGPARLLVDPHGNAYLVPLSDELEPMPFEHQGQLQSVAGVVSGRLWRSPSAAQSVEASGEVLPRWSMALDLEGVGLLDGSHLALDFDPAWDRGSSIARIAGSWHSGDVMLYVDAAGTVLGSDLAGSSYQGSIHAPWPQINLYTIELDAWWPGAGFPTVFDGVASLVELAGPTDALLITMAGSSSLFLPIVYWSPQLGR